MVTPLHGRLHRLKGFKTVGAAMMMMMGMAGIAPTTTIAIHSNSNTGSGCIKDYF